MPVSLRCPHCGGKLAANTVRLAWCVDHTPVRDWMCWNAVMRIVLPVLGLTLLLTILLEAIMSGLTGVAMLLGGGIVFSLLGLLLMLLPMLLLVFILQGDDLLDCVLDSRGLHVQQYLPNPTPLKLLLRLKSPRLMDNMGDEPFVLIAQKEIAWKDVQRVQLWPEKTMILLYSPRWWMRLSLPCTPFTWDDALSLIRDKLGKKKAVILPPECRQETPTKGTAPRKLKEQQLSIHDAPLNDVPTDDWLPPQPIPEEEVPPDWRDDAEKTEDFTPLADVLQELQAAESQN